MTSILPDRRRLGLHAQRVVDLRQVAGLELDVDDRTDDLNDFSDLLVSHVCFPQRILQDPA